LEQYRLIFSLYDDDMNDYKKETWMSCRIDFAEPSGRSWAAEPHLQQQKQIIHAAMALVKLSRYKASIILSSEVRPSG
jgi:hypothetical protein